MTNHMTTAPETPGASTPGGSRCEPADQQKGDSSVTLQPPSPWTELYKLAPTPSPANRYQADQWNPWQALAEDYRDYIVTSDYKLPDSVLGMSLGKRIWLNSELTELQKTCTLAHELVHIELGIFNGHHSIPKSQYLEGERKVREVTARRMVPFRDLAKVMVSRPDALFRAWAYMLRVDVPTLHDRFLTMSPVERAALTAVRGGSLPSMPHDLYDEEVAC